MRLALAVDTLVALWPRLAVASGESKGNGHPSHKSRPPATLAVVALVMDVTVAAREGCLDLTGRAHASTPQNLLGVVHGLTEDPSEDQADWWTGAAIEWTHRARVLLGEEPNLTRDVYGARCPHCQSVFTVQRTEGEDRLTPAVGVIWRELQPDHWEVHMVHCRACSSTWARGEDLDYLVMIMLTTQDQAEATRVSITGRG